MNFQSELSGLLEERISRYYQDLNVEEVGIVLSIDDGIARVPIDGLQNVQAGINIIALKCAVR
jgi:F0F1-type ATP synthase alpha subunit